MLLVNWPPKVELSLLLYTASNVAIKLFVHGLTGQALALGCLTIASIALASQTQLTQRLAATHQAKPAADCSLLHGLLGFPCMFGALSQFNPGLQGAFWVVVEGSAVMCIWLLALSAVDGRRLHNKQQSVNSILLKNGWQFLALNLLIPVRAAMSFYWNAKQTKYGAIRLSSAVNYIDVLYPLLDTLGMGTAVALHFVLTRLPMTFTLAEAMMVAQGSVLGIWSGMSLLLPTSQPSTTAQLLYPPLTAMRFTAYLVAVVVVLFGTAWVLPVPWMRAAYYRQQSATQDNNKADDRMQGRGVDQSVESSKAGTAQKSPVAAAACWLLFVLVAAVMLLPAVAWVLFIFLPGYNGLPSLSKQTTTNAVHGYAVDVLNFYHTLLLGTAFDSTDQVASTPQLDILSSSHMKSGNGDNSQLIHHLMNTSRTVLQSRLLILAYWGLLVVASLILQAWLVKEGSSKPAKFKIPLIIVRKGYHVLALALLVPVLAWDMHMLVVSLAIAFALLMCLELARAKGLPLVGAVIHRFMSRFVDERDDEASMYMTHIALLVGLAGPVWLSYAAFTNNQAISRDMNLKQMQGDVRLSDTTAHTSMWLVGCAGLVSIGVGDAVASVVGKCFGRARLHRGTKKTWEGTLCSALVMLLCNIWIVGGCRRLLALSWQAQLVIAVHTVGAAILEAVTDQLDNMVVPLWASTWMALSVSQLVKPT